jgi:hypothetical protein
MGGVPCTYPSIIFHKREETVDFSENTKNFNMMKIYEFFTIVFECLPLSHECVLISLVYLEKLMTQAGVEIRVSNWRPLLATCIVLATKYWEECSLWNSDYAEITDFDTSDINRMESQAIGLLEYNLFISKQ